MIKKMNRKTEFKRLKSTPGMWAIFIIFLLIISGISIFFWSRFFYMLSEDAIPTKVFTVENDVVSIKLPDGWDISESSNNKQITFTTSNGYESLSISKTSETSIASASITYMLELRSMFPDVDASSLAYTETDIDGKKMYITQLMYKNRYYLCGVRESGNTIIRFVYSASAMTGKISDIDTIITSINFREGKNFYE